MNRHEQSSLRRGLRAPDILAAAYAAFGAVWILVSDTALETLVDDPHALTAAQTWKGWFFVGASALLIAALGRALTRRLAEAERRYRALFSESPVPMVLADPATGVLVECNPAAATLLGRPLARLVGWPWPDMLVPGQRDEAQRMLARLETGAAPITSRWTMICGDGHLIQVEAQGATVTFFGRPLRLAALTDVTARLQAEEALMSTMDKLRRHENDRAQLAHALAHDLREPIRQVVSFVQLLERRYHERLDADAESWIAFAVEGATRLTSLLSDAESFTSGPLWRPEAVDMERVLDNVVRTLSQRLDGAGAMLCLGELPVVDADPRTLPVILSALLDNAAKFRRPDGPCRIHVTVAPTQPGWVVSVRDNGPGIEPEYAEAVFTLFARLQTRDRAPGNGTGLALARKLVEAGGGRIWVDSGSAEGADLRFTLPAGRPDGARRH